MTAVMYRYTALDAAGGTRRGTVDAESELLAMRAVIAEGLHPVAVEPTTRRAASSWKRSAGVSAASLAGMTREITVMLKAHAPLDQGLLAIAEQESDRALSGLLKDVARRIQAGETLSEAVGRHASTFGDVYVASIRAAERTGRLTEIMDDLAVTLERRVAAGRAMKRALTYPAAVVSVIVLAIVVLLAFVVPSFAKSFSGGAAELPALTRAVAAIGESLRVYWWAYLAVPAAIGIIVRVLWRRPAGRRLIERATARAPVLGKLYEAIATARFARVLSLALGAGLDLTESIQLAGRATGRAWFCDQSEAVVNGLRSGRTLSETLAQAGHLPAFARRLLTAGKDAEELSSAAQVVAGHYEDRTEHLAQSLGTLVEPILTVVMAGVVLVVALSVFQPMWQVVGMQP